MSLDDLQEFFSAINKYIQVDLSWIDTDQG
jgi:hypothetical protein